MKKILITFLIVAILIAIKLGYGKVKIDPETLDPEDVETLEELIMLAVNDAGSKVNEANEAIYGGMAGGLGSFFIQKGAGLLFDASAEGGWNILGCQGIEAGYLIMFTFCGLAYLFSWAIMKSLVPVYKPIVLE